VRVFISIDMEGIAGVATRQQVRRGSDDYPAARRLMTNEANAAVAGAFDGGATSVVVNDSHGDMSNLLVEELDPRAEVIVGTPKIPYGMVQGGTVDVDLALFIGYHAGAGVPSAILAHTYSGRDLYDVRVNGSSVSEAELNAALLGEAGVPVGLITGDEAACESARTRLPWVRTVAVKRAMGVEAAASLHPTRAAREIREAANCAVRYPAQFRTLRIDPPYVLEADVRSLQGAELCSLAPGTEITSRTVSFQTDRLVEAFRCLLAWIYLAGSAD
jgi:D-amino peptidase